MNNFVSRFVAFLVTFTAVLALSSPASAFIGLCCAKCGGNMPVTIPGGGIPETYEFRFKVTPSFMHMEGLRDGTSSVAPSSILGVPGPGSYMAVPTAMDMSMLNMTLGYSFSDRWFGGIMTMFGEKRMDMKFNGAMVTATGQPGFTMESKGLMDTMLMSKYRLYADDPQIPTRQMSLMGTLSLPTGSIDEVNDTHPVPTRKTELLPYGMQLGSGTVDPGLALLYSASSSPWWWGANLSGTWRLYENKRDYRQGNRYGLDLYAMRQVRYDLVLHGQLNGEVQHAIGGVMDRFADGTSGRAMVGPNPMSPMTPLWETENYGGEKAFVSAGFQWQPKHMQVLDVTVQLPIYQNLNGPQLEDDYRVMLTWYKEIPTSRSIRSGASQPSTLGF
jgi:hypothetical protein